MIQGDNNYIIINSDGRQWKKNLKDWRFPGLLVQIYGSNNTITVHKCIRCQGTQILIGTPDCPNNNAVIEIGPNSFFENNIIHVNYGDGQKLSVGAEAMIQRCSIALTEQSKCFIGTGCLFGTGVSIRGNDGHTVFDSQTGQIINGEISKCIIGNHVWVGRNVTILKKAIIPDNSIVAECSVVTEPFLEKGILLAGVPAVVKKTGVNWDKRPPSYFLKYGINPNTEKPFLKNESKTVDVQEKGAQ